MTQTILGSGGAIGTSLAMYLAHYTSNIRLVSRNPRKVNDSDTLFKADLTNADDVRRAVEGSSICYLTVGIRYNTKQWQRQWPVIIRNVAEACIMHHCKLVFFDNVYALDPDHYGQITEDTPIRPASKKGEVRAFVDLYLHGLMEKQSLVAMIVRSPDFFGPMKQSSMLMTMVYDNLMKGKPAQWLCDAGVPHNMGYVPELAKATALLGNTPDAYHQIWNLPTHSQCPTGQQWIEMIAGLLDKPAKVSVLSTRMMRLLGTFVPILKELYDVRAQFERPYFFDSSKFEKRFDFQPITHLEALKQTIETLNQPLH
ncbi:MAG TPA: NAD-dependent epimerase/dehydratase family protein [Bacteroidales bacterium]|nr:NAD-dependent epimerase/dehydratase family protein [Bacteroidales bacterium]